MTREIEPDQSIAASRKFTDGTPDICETLGEIRDGIDALDAKIVTLLAERARLVRDAVRFKKNMEEVPAPARQRAVIERVRQLAEGTDTGLDGFPALVEEVYGVLVPGFVKLQREVMGRTRLIEEEG